MRKPPPISQELSLTHTRHNRTLYVALTTALFILGLAVVVARPPAGGDGRSSKTTSSTTTTAATTTTSATTTSTSAPFAPGSGYYGSNSPWNTPIPANPAIIPQSSTWMTALYGDSSAIGIATSHWTPAVWYVDSSTPRKTWYMSGGWIMDNVPTPANLATSPDGETWTAIVDKADGLEYDFFDATKSSSSPSGWTATNGGVIRLNGSGWWDNRVGPWIGRVSGDSNLGGLILASDAQAGVINHALGCVTPNTMDGSSAVSPATAGDPNGSSSGLPMGSHLQLDPSLDISTLGLEPGEAMVARALQVYGCYVVDSASGFALYAENYHFLPGGANPYPSSWANGISKELVRRMRVVTPPPTPTYDDSSVLNQPHK